MATKQKHKERSRRSYRQNKNMAIQFFSQRQFLQWSQLQSMMNK